MRAYVFRFAIQQRTLNKEEIKLRLFRLTPSLGFLTLPKPLIAGSRWRATQRVFSFCRARHSLDTAFQADAFGAEKSSDPPLL